MSDKQLNLSRRKTLAALGAIGAASAGAGLGTSALFNDQESFQNDRLVAGSLDLKMDWEEHYYWNHGSTDDLDVRTEPPEENPDDYRQFPAGSTDGGLWVRKDDVDRFMANTALEAFPDVNGDGLAEFPNNGTACQILADVGGNDAGLSTFSDPNSEDLGRTDNEDTRLDDGSAAPMINLQDVKPGDFGEVTFSTHLCHNDGYLWMNAPTGYTASENGVTEPEGEASGERSNKVELLDEIRTSLWYDNNCNNLPDTSVDPLDLMVVVDTSGSIDQSEMNQIKAAADVFADTLPTDTLPSGEKAVKAGLMRFSGYQEQSGPTDDEMEVLAPLGDVDRFTNGSQYDSPSDLLPNEGDGNTAMPGALDLARMILNDSASNEGRSDARKVILLVSDGAPDYAQDAAGDGNTGDGYVQYDVVHDGKRYTSNKFAGGGSITNSSEESEKDETAALARDIDTGPTGYSGNSLHTTDFDGDDGIEILAVGIDSDPNSSLNAYLQNRIATTPNDFYSTSFGPDLQTTAQQIVHDLVVLAGEEGIFSGTLRDLLDELTGNDGRGIPLDGDRINGSFDELSDPENAGTRQCFDASATHCFGFSWWLPSSVGNEVQSDSVSFDLGFYTEQCRHNDGSGTAMNT